MKSIRIPRFAFLFALAGALLVLPAPRACAQTLTDEIEVLRGVLQADRKVVVAEAMQLSEGEGSAFWPLYRGYRADMEKIGDGIVKLVLEYADAYPDVSEDRAARILKEYLRLEREWTGLRSRHLKRIGKVLPASKVLRFAQVENRLDLALRLQIASAVPMLSAR